MRAPHRSGRPDWLTSIPTRGIYVYDLETDNGLHTLVAYVGCSRRPRDRVKIHLRTRGDRITWVRLHGPFRTREDAEAFEEARIAALRPPWNIEGVRKPYRPALAR